MTDLASLWDFDDPEGSLARFAAAAGRADEPDHSVLLTQAARAHGLAGRFASGHRILDSLEPLDAEVAVRVALERGRLWRSEALAAEDSARAEALLTRAAGQFESVARREPTDDVLAGLQLDALHMLALLPTDPAEQVAATRRALAVAEASGHPAARRWRAPLLNNLGMAQHDAGDDAGALASFEAGFELREQAGDRRGAQVARWTVGWAMRLLGRRHEARQVQLALRDELVADGVPTQYVDEELALLGEA